MKETSKACPKHQNSNTCVALTYHRRPILQRGARLGVKIALEPCLRPWRNSPRFPKHADSQQSPNKETLLEALDVERVVFSPVAQLVLDLEPVSYSINPWTVESNKKRGMIRTAD